MTDDHHSRRPRAGARTPPSPELRATGGKITHSEQARQDSARLAAIVAGAEDAIVSKTLQGVITSWNRSAEAIFGFTAAEAVGHPITIIIPPERLHEEEEILSRIRQGIATEHFETERLRKDGTRITVSVNISPVRDENGKIIGVSKIARDITERRRSDERLKATIQTLDGLYRLVDRVAQAKGRDEICEAGMEAVLSAANTERASVLALDGDGVMRFVCGRGLSDAYHAAIDGTSPWPRDVKDPSSILVEDVRTDPRTAALLPVLEREGIRALGFIPLYQDRLLGNFVIHYDTPHRFREDEVRLARTIARHAAFGLSRVDSDARIDRLLGRERQARRDADSARAEAERANQTKDEFLAMLAHELRNPLSVIVNAVGVVDVVGVGGRAEAVRAVAMIRRQADHLARLLEDLLDVARITSGHINLEREILDLGLVVMSAVEAQRHRTEAKRQELSCTLPEQAATVDGDPVRLQQVVENLLNNASKYTPPGGSIHLGLSVEGEQAVLRVRDNGTGVPTHKLDSIFELFEQANPTLARTEGGLGIGLTLVRKVLGLHGGDVHASSEGPGTGAEFTVRLPLSRENARGSAAASERNRVASRRILVIEDHEDGREMLVAILQHQGHRVLEAATGTDGMEAALKHAPEIALIDIGLPDIDGYEVGRQLRQRLGGRILLVALTGYGQPADRARSVSAGFDAHLVKPIDPHTLGQTLESLRSPDLSA